MHEAYSALPYAASDKKQPPRLFELSALKIEEASYSQDTLGVSFNQQSIPRKPNLYTRSDQKQGNFNMDQTQGNMVDLANLAPIPPPKYLADKVDTMVRQIVKTSGKGLMHMQRKEVPRAKEVLEEADTACN